MISLEEGFSLLKKVHDECIPVRARIEHRSSGTFANIPGFVGRFSNEGEVLINDKTSGLPSVTFRFKPMNLEFWYQDERIFDSEGVKEYIKERLGNTTLLIRDSEFDIALLLFFDL